MKNALTVVQEFVSRPHLAVTTRSTELNAAMLWPLTPWALRAAVDTAWERPAQDAVPKRAVILSSVQTDVMMPAASQLPEPILRGYPAAQGRPLQRWIGPRATTVQHLATWLA